MDSLPARVMSDENRKINHFIDSILISILKELSRKGGHPTIAMGRRSSQPMYSLSSETGALESCNNNAAPRDYTWPGRNTQEAWRFGVMIRILSAISEAIRGDFVSSKRDIYYQDSLFFGSQKVVDRCVDDIACTIGVDRAALHVVAAAKGLTAGGFSIVLKDETVLDVGTHSEGMLIPRVSEIKDILLTDIRWILVVEKEAVFHRLATSNYHKTSAAGRGILITGKGYPDLCTRAFLRLLSETRLSGSTSFLPTSLHSFTPPIYVLVDGDPDGMTIMSTYKYGSIAQLHENANLNVRSIEWLGLRISDMMPDAESSAGTSSMPLSLRDRTKATQMLARSPVFADNGPETKWRAELQRMLVMNSKAEIEILYERQSGIQGWLNENLREMA